MAVTWQSSQLQSFVFETHSVDAGWHDKPGLYLFCGQDSQGTWWPKYIGQASSFKDRLCNHEQWAPAVAQGATHVLAMVVPQQAERDRLEAILIGELDPPLNVQLRNPISALGFSSAQVRLAQWGVPK
jgi:hypothetical protein